MAKSHLCRLTYVATLALSCAAPKPEPADPLILEYDRQAAACADDDRSSPPSPAEPLVARCAGLGPVGVASPSPAAASTTRRLEATMTGTRLATPLAPPPVERLPPCPPTTTPPIVHKATTPRYRARFGK